MLLILKNSFKNIFGKPLRTILIVLSIFTCSLCAYFCFDIGSTIGDLAASLLGNISSADISVSSGGMDLSDISSVLPKSDVLLINKNSETVYSPIPGEYNYVTTVDLQIYGMDMDAGAKMGFLKDLRVGRGEILLSESFAEKNGYKAGDTITLHDRAYLEVPLKVAGVIPKNTQNILLRENAAVVDFETGTLLSCGYGSVDEAQIDLRDDSLIEDVMNKIKERYPDATVTQMALTESSMAALEELQGFLYLIFAILFLIVIFVTASVSNRIVSERMSFIGTLRSLGMSSGKTGRILILENALYALLGSIPATILYVLFRPALLGSLITVQTDEGESLSVTFPNLSVMLPVGIILGAVVIECLIPLRAILRALRTSIRDIIFDNRDTEYRFSRVLTVLGLLCLVLGVVSFFRRTSLPGATFCLVFSVMALAFLFPWILKGVSFLIRKISDRTDRPSWSLAAVETISRKSTVGSGVLLATASAMCVLIVSIAGSMSASMAKTDFACDAILTCSKSGKYYSYVDHLDGVTETERIYSTLEEVVVGEDTIQASLIGYPDGGYHLYTAYEDLPSKIEDGTVLIDSRYAEKNGIKTGDALKITTHPDGLLPVTREYTVAGTVTPPELEGGSASIFFSENEYLALFKDFPFYILIRCEDPEKIVSTIRTYGRGTYLTVKTALEEEEDAKASSAQFTAIMGALITLAIGMTCIGTISNQLIGFVGRKKECAVMLSTAMSRSKLSFILLKEVLITSLAAAGSGCLLGHLLTHIIGDAVDNAASIGILIRADIGRTFLFFLLLALIFTLTVLFPIRNLLKMKIAEQIKYE
ncbi:MAG: FtsX-like permease family protein [Clostridiales bacterium]|nr:FtsX-like permease family protein [Clostridiales bacterium]